MSKRIALSRLKIATINSGKNSKSMKKLRNKRGLPKGRREARLRRFQAGGVPTVRRIAKLDAAR